MVTWFSWLVNASAWSAGRLGSLSAAVGLAFDDEFVAGGDESVDGGLGEEWVAHDGDPFAGVAVRGDDGAGFLVAFDDQFVEVRGFGAVHGFEGEVVEDEYFDAGQGAHLGFDAVVQAGGLEGAEHLIGAQEPHGAAPADRDVPESHG